MSKEIKFRIWDKDKGVMLCYDNDVVPLLTLNGVLVDAGITGHSTNVSYRFILMQYTGLKDKEGVEIYEGDIVRYGSHPEVHAIIWWEDYAAFVTDDYGYITKVWCSSVEVIGNIHTTPELLEK